MDKIRSKAEMKKLKKKPDYAVVVDAFWRIDNGKTMLAAGSTTGTGESRWLGVARDQAYADARHDAALVVAAMLREAYTTSQPQWRRLNVRIKLAPRRKAK